MPRAAKEIREARVVPQAVEEGLDLQEDHPGGTLGEGLLELHGTRAVHEVLKSWVPRR